MTTILQYIACYAGAFYLGLCTGAVAGFIIYKRWVN
jgi:hypothetical protein